MEKYKLAIFASGTGSNAKKIIEHFTSSNRFIVSMIVCNNPRAGVINIANDHCIPVLIIERERFFRGDGYLGELQKAGISFLVLAGFLWKIPEMLIKAYRENIVNIHPALLPKYGGKGMYGNYVHEAVLASGDKESGITIHYVDELYDHGSIVFQAKCPVLPQDTPGTLADRIHKLEHEYYPKIVEEIILKKLDLA